MQAPAEPGRNTRRRAATALLVCVLALASVSVARHNRTTKHSARAGVVSTSSGDALHAVARVDHAATTGTAPADVAALISWPATADSSTVAHSRTAGSPPVRGPPAEALA